MNVFGLVLRECCLRIRKNKVLIIYTDKAFEFLNSQRLFYVY